MAHRGGTPREQDRSMAPARNAGAQAVIWTTGWLLLPILLREGGSAAGRVGRGRVEALRRRAPRPLRRGLKEGSPHPEQKGCGKDRLPWSEGTCGKDSCPGRGVGVGLWEKLFHPEKGLWEGPLPWSEAACGKGSHPERRSVGRRSWSLAGFSQGPRLGTPHVVHKALWERQSQL